MIDNHILGPIFIHLFSAILQLMAWRKTVTQRVISILGSFLGVLLAIRLLSDINEKGVLTLNASNWEAPYGIVFVADLHRRSCRIILFVHRLE
jgi:multicomponent Na+:H+ antiporter subunit D